MSNKQIVLPLKASLYHAYVRIFCVTGTRECSNVVNCSATVEMGEKGDEEP